MKDAHSLDFKLTTEAALTLPAGRIVKKYCQVRARHTKRVETYFDTPRLVLRKRQIELKVSQAGAHRVQEVRAATEGSEPRTWRVDLLDHAPPALERIDSLPRELRSTSWDARLQPVFSSYIDRTTLRLQKGDCAMDLTIDVGYLRADKRSRGRVFEDVCEARLELVSGDTPRMMQVALELLESRELRLWHQSIGVRGYALLRSSLRPKSQKAKKVHLHREMTVGEALSASVEAALEHLFSNEAATLAGHPEGIHQSRVAIRRLRAIMRAFKKGLPYGGRKAFNYEFRWFQQKMGPARDWHVFLDETISQMVKDGIDERLIEKLLRIAREQRRRTSRDAAQYLMSRRFSRLQLQFERWLALLHLEDPHGKLKGNLVPFARSVLEKTHRDLLIDTRPLARMSSVEFHALRLRGKKARYAGEFFRALYPEELTTPQLKLLARFQNKLGVATDANVARQILTTLKPGRLSQWTIGAVNQWSGQRIHACALKAQPLWRQLQKLEPFWRAPIEALGDDPTATGAGSSAR